MTRKLKIAFVLLLIFLVGLLTGLFLINHLVIGLNLNQEVEVVLEGLVPFSTQIEKQVDVEVQEQLQANVVIAENLTIPLKETFDIPLDMIIKVPIAADMFVDQMIHLEVNVPVNTTLTEKELKLEGLQVPLDTDVYIDDEIDLDLVVPLDTEVTTLLGVKVPVKADIPIKMKVPLRQKVRIKDTLVVNIDSLNVPLKMILPVKIDVPLKQNIHVSGNVETPISQVLKIPLEKTIRAKIPTAIPVKVELNGTIPINLQADFDSAVTIHERIPVRLGKLKLKAENLELGIE